MCRRHSGAAFLTYVSVDRSAFELERGELVYYRSSKDALRSHCGSCGSPLTFVSDADPDRVWVTMGSLDNPGAITPTESWFVKDKLHWVQIDETAISWLELPPEQ
jgi:hypothetical protein